MDVAVTTGVTIPVTLADFTRPSLLVPRLRQDDPAGIIGELSQFLQRDATVPDVLSFYQAALNQELMNNSATEAGIALPHARLGGVRQLCFALGRTVQPVSWGPKGSPPVQLIFLIAVPATDAAGYLHLLASLARLGQTPELVSELVGAPSSEAMYAALEKLKLRQG